MYVRYNVRVKGAGIMTNTSATALRKDLFNILSNTIKYNETINVSTKEGNAIILSEEEYNGIMATLEICSDTKLKNKIIAGAKESLDDCVDIDEVAW